ARTWSTRAVMVAADRGSRLPWARATSAGAVIGGASLRGGWGGAEGGGTGRGTGRGRGVRRSLVDPALGLVPAGPAAAARVLARGDPGGARPAPDRGVAVVDERVDQDAVVGDVALDLLVAPPGQRR